MSEKEITLLLEIAKVIFPDIIIKYVNNKIEHNLLFNPNHRQYMVGNEEFNRTSCENFFNNYLYRKLPPFVVKDVEFKELEVLEDKIDYLVTIFQIEDV